MAPAAARHQVSQATFDAVVREAMTDFGLAPEQALAEAREQLAAAGVTDLSNILTSVAPDSAASDHPVIPLLQALESATASDNNDNAEAASPALRDALVQLGRAARKCPETRGVAGARGALARVARALEIWPLEAAGALAALCANCEVNRTLFVALPGGMDALRVAVVRMDPGPEECSNGAQGDRSPGRQQQQQHQLQLHNNENDDDADDDDNPLTDDGGEGDRRNETEDRDEHHRAVSAVLRSVYVVLDRNENAKCAFVADGRAVNAILRLLRVHSHSPAVVRACCSVLRTLISADDDTKLVSETFNRARMLCGSAAVMDSGLVPLAPDIEPLPVTLFRILSRQQQQAAISPNDGVASSKGRSEAPGVTIDCLALARMCAVSDEICGTLVELDYPSLVFALLSPKSGSVPIGLARTCFSMLRNLGARDDTKAALCARMSVVSAVMDQHACDAQLSERYCGVLAALCLRRPDLAVQLGELHDAVDAVLIAMRCHADVAAVQRAGCIALRNLVVRTDAQKRRVREDGNAELLLRKAMSKFPADCDDCAYNALYDLDVLADSEMRRDRRYTTPF